MFGEDEKGVGREGSSEFPYLQILIKIWPGYWIIHLNSMNQKVDEDNGKSLNKGNVRYQKFVGFHKWILEEHWLSRLISYLWSWWVKAVGE